MTEEPNDNRRIERRLEQRRITVMAVEQERRSDVERRIDIRRAEEWITDWVDKTPT